MKWILAVPICILLLIPGPSQARTWLVRQDGSGDCTTIQVCCDSAATSDTVLVAPGTYSEHVSLARAFVLLSEGGLAVTIITAPSAFDLILYMYYDGTVVDGFTIRDADCFSGWPGVGGVYVGGGTLRNCLIINNTFTGIDGPGDAGAVKVAYGGTIEQNTIVSNGQWVIAGGIYCAPNFTGQIVRNIVAQNTDGYGIYCEAGASPTFICNNVWGNAGGEYGGACTDPTGTNGNISFDPMFCDTLSENFRLQPGSPCLDAPGCGLIGALGEGCPPIGVEEPTTFTTWGRIKVLFR